MTVEAVFLKLLNMSIAATWLIPVVLLLRLLLKKAPKAWRVSLWALVGVRLCCPFSLESVLSLIPSAETVPPDIAYAPLPQINSGIPVINSTVNPILNEVFIPEPSGSVNPMQVVLYAASVLWLVGVAAMLIYTVVSYVRLRLRVRESIPTQSGVWECDRIATPFILGVFRPRIYLPSAMNEVDKAYVLAHEKAHLRRRDHWWKPLGFLLLAVYWFNPVLWLSYVLLCRDIELACDERVIRELGADSKKPYAEALVNCSVPRHLVAACPLAFGEVGVKGRIKSVLNYKKPAFWVLLAAVIASVAVAVCFLTNPKPLQEELTPQNGRVFFYAETTEEGKEPPVNFSTYFTDEELHELCEQMKQQTWVNDAVVDRLPFRFDGELQYSGTVYFGYEDKVLLYQGERGTYYCVVTEETLKLFRDKTDRPSPISHVSMHKNISGTVSVQDKDKGTLTDYHLLHTVSNGDAMLVRGEKTAAGYTLRLLVRGETTGLQYAFEDLALEAELYGCDIDGDKRDEIVVHQCVDMFGGAGQFVSYVFKTEGDDLRTLFCSNGSAFDTGFAGAGFSEPYVTEDGRSVPVVKITNTNTEMSVILDVSGEDWSAYHYSHEENVAQAEIDFDNFYAFTPQDINGDDVCEIVAKQYAFVSTVSHACGVGNAQSVLSFDAKNGAFTVVGASFETTLPVLPDLHEEMTPTDVYASSISACKAVVDAVLSDSFERDWNNGTLQLPAPVSALEERWSNMIVEATRGLSHPTRESFGFIFKDINGDGTKEMFFVREDHTVLAVFTAMDGKPYLADAFWSRHECVVLDQGFLYTHSSEAYSDVVYALTWIDAATDSLALMRSFGWKDGVPFETLQSKIITATEDRVNEILTDIPYCHGAAWMSTAILPIE